MQTGSSSFLSRALRAGTALSLVALVTVVDYRLLQVNSSTAAFSYLLIVLGLAARCGLEESVTASVAGVLCYNFFFLPPIGAFSISDPQNWIALVAFLVTAITASQLSAVARKQAQEASARRLEMERLYELSRGLILGGERSLPNQIAEQVSSIFQVREAAFYQKATDSVVSCGAERQTLPELALREVARSGKTWSESHGNVSIVPVRLGNHFLGSLGISGETVSTAGLSAIAQLAAIALERERERQIANRREATRQNEQLKATLLDAVAHEFKTPLTSIKAAATTLLSKNSHGPVEQDLLSVIDEEADRLTKLVSEAIKIARIEAGDIRLHRQPYSVAELISSALKHEANAQGERAIQVMVSADLPDLDVDADLAELAVRQLVGNALKYAPPLSPIRVAANRDSGGHVVITVANDGPGIPANELEHIFEKFYRGREVRELIPGTGMGLAITREIVNAHGGRIWVDSSAEAGVRFSLTFPVTTQETPQTAA